VYASAVSFGSSILFRIRGEKAAGAVLYYYLQLRSHFNVSGYFDVTFSITNTHKKIVCRKMQPEKIVCTDNNTEKIVCLEKIVILPPSKKVMVRP